MKKLPKVVPAHIIKLSEALETMFDVGSWDRGIRILKEDKDNLSCSIQQEEDYQRFTINLYPLFFTQTRLTQRADLVHEFCHTITNKTVRLLDDFKEGKFVTEKQIKFQSERATSQMANLFDALLDGQYLSKRKAYKEYLKLPKKRNKKK